MSEADLTKLSLTELFDAQNTAAQNLSTAKGEAAAVAAEMARRYGESAKQALGQAGKEYGSITLPLQDGFKVRAEAKMTVSWDSAKLLEVAQTLPWDRVNALFKITFAMPEAIYKGVAALSPELREKIDAARTTKIAEPAVALMKDA